MKSYCTKIMGTTNRDIPFRSLIPSSYVCRYFPGEILEFLYRKINIPQKCEVSYYSETDFL